jgi:Transposase, Mutator family
VDLPANCENKRLRLLVPRIYGLGDFSQILDERDYTQAKALLASLSEDLSKVVLTSAYHRAADPLDQHGFVLLIGEPSPGKTTIASMLSMGQPRTSGMTAQRSRDEHRFPQISLANRESSSSWTEFCWRLKDASYRALYVVSDDQPGLKAAIREVLPESAWQRCYVHFLRNALDYVPQRRGGTFDSTPNHVNMTVQVRLRGGSVPIAVPALMRNWWPMMFFMVFKSPAEGRTHIFRPNEPSHERNIIRHSPNYFSANILNSPGGSVMLPNRARNKSPGTSGSRRGDDFTPRPRKTVILQPITRDWAVATHFAATRALRRLKGSDTVSVTGASTPIRRSLLVP